MYYLWTIIESLHWINISVSKIRKIISVMWPGDHSTTLRKAVVVVVSVGIQGARLICIRILKDKSMNKKRHMSNNCKNNDELEKFFKICRKWYSIMS